MLPPMHTKGTITSKPACKEITHEIYIYFDEEYLMKNREYSKIMLPSKGMKVGDQSPQLGHIVVCFCLNLINTKKER